jgi:hypothetical protein
VSEIENEYIKVLAGLNKKIDNSIESANQVASGKYPPEQLHTVYKMIESKRGEGISRKEACCSPKRRERKKEMRRGMEEEARRAKTIKSIVLSTKTHAILRRFGK